MIDKGDKSFTTRWSETGPTDSEVALEGVGGEIELELLWASYKNVRYNHVKLYNDNDEVS